MISMRTGAVLSIIVLAFGFAPGSGSTFAGSHPLRVKDFDPGLIMDVRLDQVLTFRVKGRVREKHLGFEHFPIESVGGENPRGTFFKGRLLLDPDSGTIVTIDPDEFSEEVIAKIEKRARIDLIPRDRRYDLGAVSLHRGNRRVLIDRSRKGRKLVTFLPAVPTRDDLSDAAFRPNMPYFVHTPGKRGIREEFLTVSGDDPHLFIGTATEGRPRIIHSDPEDSDVLQTSDARIFLRFSHPLDPRTVAGQEGVILNVVSVAGRPGIPVATLLRQTTLGLVELVVTPEQPLPPNEWFELTLTMELRNLLGHSIAPGTSLSFSTGDFPAVTNPVSESFETNDQEDAAATDADWNGSVPGALVGGAGTTTGQSLWFSSWVVTPDYGTPVVDLQAGGGTIEILVQGSREDVSLPGNQPVDPDADPERLHTTDWVRLDQVDSLDNYQYLRFRVVFTGGDPAPVVTSLSIPVGVAGD